MGAMVLMGACGPPETTDQKSGQTVIQADPIIVESSDGNRYQCERVLNQTYPSYFVSTLIDCQKIKE